MNHIVILNIIYTLIAAIHGALYWDSLKEKSKARYFNLVVVVLSVIIVAMNSMRLLAWQGMWYLE